MKSDEGSTGTPTGLKPMVRRREWKKMRPGAD
jgi:hypothetical protein